jgi:hypothetical protein
MTPHKQLNLHKPLEGQIGDCFRTVIACLLDLHPSDVPHFYQEVWHEPDAAQTAERELRKFLRHYDLDFIEVAYKDTLLNVMEAQAIMNPGIYYLLTGNSANGVGHVVICCGDQIVHDPAIDNSGIVGPSDTGNYHITWLVPSLMRRLAC